MWTDHLASGEYMTTPQALLQNLEYKIRKVCEMLEGDENSDNIAERLNHLELQNVDIVNSQQRLENYLNLVVKLLSKDE
jgi:predicted nucleic acid-binding protein